MSQVDKFAIGILTLSDKGARGEREDISGQVIREMVAPLGSVLQYQVVADDVEQIVAKLVDWADAQKLDLILTTGGTGMSPRDVTPEATLRVIDWQIPGMAEAMRASSMQITPHAMLSRALAGVRGQTMIINLPGSPKGVRENLAVVLPALEHGIRKLKGDPSDCAQ